MKTIGEIMQSLPDVCPISGEISLYNLIKKHDGKTKLPNPHKDV
jgi:hypothetical protein